jgi:hypothetical protein
VANYEKHSIIHKATLETVSSVLSKDKLEEVSKFTEEKGLYVTYYDIVNDLWHATDGEVYSTKTIILANLEADILQLDEVDDPLDGRP